MIGPWRSTPAVLPSGTNDRFDGKEFPSGRQVLSEIIRAAGLRRSDRVAVPEWSSACVLGAVSAFATPVLMPDAMTSPKPPAAVLVYDQWGWARRPGAIESIRARWPDAFIVHDTVDTADLDIAEEDTAKRSARLWSFSKILGLSGGGVGRQGGEFLSFVADPSHRDVSYMLERAAQQTHLCDDIAKTSIRYLPSGLETIVATKDLDAAFAGERTRRAANLAAVRNAALADEWPDWMNSPRIEGGAGLYPILRGRSPKVLEEFRGLIAAEVGVDLPAYHFDFAGAPLEPRYENCLALPLHGEMMPDRIEQVAQLVARLPART